MFTFSSPGDAWATFMVAIGLGIAAGADVFNSLLSVIVVTIVSWTVLPVLFRILR